MARSEDDIRQLWGKLVAQSWADDDLRRRLLHDPVAVLREHGVEVPPEVSVRTFEDDGNTIVLPLPGRPSTEELSEQELDSVAGGRMFGTVGLPAIRSIRSFGSLASVAKDPGVTVSVVAQTKAAF